MCRSDTVIGADWFHMVHPSVSAKEKSFSGSFEVKREDMKGCIFKNDVSTASWFQLVSRA